MRVADSRQEVILQFCFCAVRWQAVLSLYMATSSCGGCCSPSCVM